VLDGPFFENPLDSPVVTNTKDDVVLNVEDLKQTLKATHKYLQSLKEGDLLALFENGAKIDKAESSGSIGRSSVLPSNLSNNLVIKILTNTKLNDGNRNRDGFLGKGASKTFKNCVELKFDDSNLLFLSDLYARGSIILGPKDNQDLCAHELSRLKRDVQISHRYPNAHIAPLSLGPQYQKIDKNSLQASKAIYVFSELALCNLAEIEDHLTKEELAQVNKEKANNIIPSLYVQLFSQVLQGLICIHEHGDIHNDIKGGNILIYRAENGELSAKITDFGNTTLKEDEQRSVPESTYEHCAPEIMAAGIYDTGRTRSLGAMTYKENKNLYSEVPTVNAKMDIWALGITISQLLIGEYPGEAPYEKQERMIAERLELIKKSNPVLEQLLAIDPLERPTAKQALYLLQNQYPVKNREPVHHSDMTFTFDDRKIDIKVEHKLAEILSHSFEEIVASFIKSYTFATDLQGQHDKLHEYKIYKEITTKLLPIIATKDLLDLSNTARYELIALCDAHTNDVNLYSLRHDLDQAQKLYNML
jgi:hypothetical protein